MQNLSRAGNATVTELRDAFDRSFAELPSSESIEQYRELLAVRIGGEPYAIPVDEISSLLKNRNIIAIPGSASELLGIAGIRGACVPVYCISALLGCTEPQRQSRWLVLCDGTEPVAFAFGELEKYMRASLDQTSLADMSRTILSIPVLIQIAKQCCETVSQRSR
jgi:chemotaxis signal transduction protein